jgi:hypothetical protein
MDSVDRKGKENPNLNRNQSEICLNRKAFQEMPRHLRRGGPTLLFFGLQTANLFAVRCPIPLFTHRQDFQKVVVHCRPQLFHGGVVQLKRFRRKNFVCMEGLNGVGNHLAAQVKVVQSLIAGELGLPGNRQGFSFRYSHGSHLICVIFG